MTMLAASEQAGSDRIREWLNDHFGIFFPDHKQDLLTHRLQEVIDQFELGGLGELAQRIEVAEHAPQDENHELLMALLHAVSTNHTFFFREPRVLHFFAHTILPSYEKQDEVRIWSAACSTGDEAYTIAILACELWGIENARRRVHILGTDMSKMVVDRAEVGIYSEPHINQTPQNILERYFRPHGQGHYRIIDAIEPMCTFRRLNLKGNNWPFQKLFHVIFCRNVLYYFDRDHQKRVLDAVYEACTPGGWLITSVTESVRDLGTQWVPVDSGIYRKLP